MISTHRISALSAITVLMLLGGCAINQTVKPASAIATNAICVIQNNEVVQAGFHPTYVDVLTRKGFNVRTLPEHSPHDTCPLSSSYEAIYRWDMAIYLARADLRIYENGKQVGHANYDALLGGANLNKFIRTETKLTELVGLLFPDKK